MRQQQETALLNAFRVLDMETRETLLRFAISEASRMPARQRLTLVAGAGPINDSLFSAVRKTKN